MFLSLPNIFSPLPDESSMGKALSFPGNSLRPTDPSNLVPHCIFEGAWANRALKASFFLTASFTSDVPQWIFGLCHNKH